MHSMSNENATNHPRKVVIPKEFTGQYPAVKNSNVLSFPELKGRQERRKNTGLKVAAGAVALIAAGGLVATAKDAYREPGVSQEKQALESLKEGTAKSSGNVYVLHGDVKVRNTPIMPSDTKGESPTNEAFKIKQGEDLIVDNAIVDGDWIGFQKSEDTFSADEVSKNTYWVNIGDLEGQVDDNGKPYVESFTAGESHDVTMYDDSGYFYEKGTDTRVAVAETVQAQNIAVALAERGIN